MFGQSDSPSAESKIDATDRLRQEGRWDEASRYRDEVRRSLKAEGKPAAEAKELAWAAMLEKYPPKHGGFDPSQPKPDRQADENGGDRPDAEDWPDAAETPPDLMRDILWAYQSLENKQASPGDAPGAGAWSLLLWGRQYRNRFFEQLLPKAITTGAKKGDDASRIEMAERKSIGQLKEVLGHILRDWEEEMIADAPAAVRKSVASLLADWCRRFSLDLPPDAANSLAAHMIRLAHQCMSRPEFRNP